MKKKLLYVISTLTLSHFISLPLAMAVEPGAPVMLSQERSIINLNGFYAVKSQLESFYKSTRNASVWGDVQVDYLKALIAKTYEHGLTPEDYDISLAESLSSEQKELFYSSLYIKVISDMVAGKIDPIYIESTVRFKKKIVKDFSAFTAALKQPDVDSFLLAFEDQMPKSPHYQKLKEALAFYRSDEVKAQFATPVAASNTEAVKARLAVLGYEGTNIKSVLTKFQTDHSMEITGAIGPKTTIALNMTAEQRVNQIKMNLERLRWLSTKMGEKFIFVNLANQRMTVYDSSAVETGGVALKMKVQVGQEFRKTPIMVTNVKQVILNPTWTAPDSIIVKDLLPKIKANPNYLASMHLRAYRGSVEVQQSEVDWSKVKHGNVPVRIVQDSGPFNTLGQVKFMLTNGDSIFMHDTDHRPEFALTKRLTSSGCVRLEKPLELAEYILRPTNSWPMEKINESLATGDPGQYYQPELGISIGYQLPVYTMYLTTEIDESGKIIFLPDYYGQDQVLSQAIQKQIEEQSQNSF